MRVRFLVSLGFPLASFGCLRFLFRSLRPLLALFTSVLDPFGCLRLPFSFLLTPCSLPLDPFSFLSGAFGSILFPFGCFLVSFGSFLYFVRLSLGSPGFLGNLWLLFGFPVATHRLPLNFLLLLFGSLLRPFGFFFASLRFLMVLWFPFGSLRLPFLFPTVPVSSFSF